MLCTNKLTQMTHLKSELINDGCYLYLLCKRNICLDIKNFNFDSYSSIIAVLWLSIKYA